MDNNAVAIAAIGLAGAILTTVVVPLMALLRAQTKATDKNTEAHMAVAQEIKKGNKEAKDRNGHLAELIIDSKGSTLDAIQNLPAQHVDTQTVDTQVVKGK